MSNDPNLAELVLRVHEAIQPNFGQGRLADYIPALVRLDQRQFGLAIVSCKGGTASVGDCSAPFSIQSVSKVFTLTWALGRLGARCGSASGSSPRVRRSTRSCSSSASRASHAIP
jgi:glutaminase